MRDSSLSSCFMRLQHQPSLWFPCFSVSNVNMLNCTILRCRRQNLSLISLTDTMRRGKWFCLFFPDSFMLLLEWKPLHQATLGQTNIYSSGIIKQTNIGGEENIWVLNTHPGVLWSWTWRLVFFASRTENLGTTAVCKQLAPFKTNCSNLFPKTEDLLMLLPVFSDINHECVFRFLRFSWFRLTTPYFETLTIL